MIADDVHIYKKSFNHNIVQIDIIIRLNDQPNGVFFNTNKCNVLHSGENNTNCDYFMYIGDHKLINSQLVEDLGVTFDPKLNFNHHIYKQHTKQLRFWVY